MKLTFFVTDEGDLRMFHVYLSSKAHPTEAVDHVSLPVLGYRVCITGNRELEGCVWDVMGPCIMVQFDLLVYFFVCSTRGIQLAHGPGERKICIPVEV